MAPGFGEGRARYPAGRGPTLRVLSIDTETLMSQGRGGGAEVSRDR